MMCDVMMQDMITGTTGEAVARFCIFSSHSCHHLCKTVSSLAHRRRPVKTRSLVIYAASLDADSYEVCNELLTAVYMP